jgi:NAD(P)H-dependent FMN reductase
MEDTKTKPNIGIIVGSNRPTRVCRAVSDWVMSVMQNDGLDISLIDLAEINLPFLDEPEIPARHNYVNDHTKEWSKLIRGFDGFVLVFPQYNWGYPAVLKNALDFLYDEWAGKPVSIMCYGNHGGLLGSTAMRQVTQGLKMNTMSINVPLNINDGMFEENGQFTDIASAFAQYVVPIKALSIEFVSMLIK